MFMTKRRTTKRASPPKKHYKTSLVVGISVLLLIVGIIGASLLYGNPEKKRFAENEKKVSEIISALQTQKNTSVDISKNCRQSQQKYGGGYWWCSVGFNVSIPDEGTFNSTMDFLQEYIDNQGYYAKKYPTNIVDNATEKRITYVYQPSGSSDSCGLTGVWNKSDSSQRLISFGCQVSVSKPLF